MMGKELDEWGRPRSPVRLIAARERAEENARTLAKPCQLRVRLPKSLYGHLVIRARREERSLNSLIVHLLADAIGSSEKA